jgi:hypothetical protein
LQQTSEELTNEVCKVPFSRGLFNIPEKYTSRIFTPEQFIIKDTIHIITPPT